MKRSVKGLMVLMVVKCLLAAVVCHAQMIVTTRDGRTLTLPVNAEEVRKIEYSSDGRHGYEYLGCFKDQGDPSGTGGRDLDGFVMNKGDMTTEFCVSTCRSKGFEYASTQYSTWCFCGASYGKSGGATNCNMPCGGNNKETCGGAWANSVYVVK